MTTPADFLASLPAALNLRGPGSARVADVRKQVRADLAAAIKVGVLPAGVKFSVRGDYNHVTVEIVAWPTFPLVTTYVDALMAETLGHKELMNAWRDDRSNRYRAYRAFGAARSSRPELTAELNAALGLIEQLVERHNFDESDSMTDYFHVGFYSDITADAVVRFAEHGIREESNPKLAALRQEGRLAAARLGKACVRSVCGRGGVEGCGEYALERLLKVDARAAGRPVAYDKFRRAWLPVAVTAASQVAAPACPTRK